MSAVSSNHLPPDIRATLRVELGSETFIFPISPARNGERTVRVRLPGRKELRFPELAGEFHAEVLFHPDPTELIEDGSLWTHAVGKYHQPFLEIAQGAVFIMRSALANTIWLATFRSWRTFPGQS